MTLRFSACLLTLSTNFLFGCSKSENVTNAPTTVASNNTEATTSVQNSSQNNFEPLLNRVWRVSNSAYGPAAGSIYIFLSNGTLLQTSCVETYRVALWSVDKTQPSTLRVVEDQQPVFTATIGESEGGTLRLRQKMLRGSEVRDITLTSVDSEFVCPDLPK
jgi:hypothetical protein